MALFLSPNLRTSDLLPSPALLLRSAALAAVLVSSVLLALGAWGVFYSALAVRVGQLEMVWLQYGHFRPPYADIPLTPAGAYFSSGQAYDVALDFVVPSTTRNVELGNFMVNLILLERDGSTSFNVSRPASLSYRSPVSLTLASLSPLALIRSPDVQHLTVPLLESAVLQSRSRIPQVAFIELGRKDAHWENGRWNGGSGEVQVYSAKLRFDAHLSGLRYLLYHHPILVFILFTPTFLFFELVAAALIWALFVARSTPLETSPPSTIDGEPPRAPRIKREFESRDRAEEREGEERRAEAEVRRGRRMEMEELGSESSTETGEESLGREEVKDEEEEEEGTIGGSETTRGTRETFGPSVASTGASSSLRARTVGSREEEE